MVAEFVGSRSKIYSCLVDEGEDEKSFKKGKGIKNMLWKIS